MFRVATHPGRGRGILSGHWSWLGPNKHSHAASCTRSSGTRSSGSSRRTSLMPSSTRMPRLLSELMVALAPRLRTSAPVATWRPGGGRGGAGSLADSRGSVALCLAHADGGEADLMAAIDSKENQESRGPEAASAQAAGTAATARVRSRTPVRRKRPRRRVSPSDL